MHGAARRPMSAFSFALGAALRSLRSHQVMRQVVAEAVLADRVGIDFFGIGEHDRPDFAISEPDVVLAAIAGQTARIRLGTSVTVLSSDDRSGSSSGSRPSTRSPAAAPRSPLGRGSFTESFPLFGSRSTTTRCCSPRSSRSSPRCSASSRSAGRAPCVRHWTASSAFPDDRRPGCPPGSVSAARRSRSSAPRRTACRWCSPSSAARPSGSRRWSTSTAARSTSYGQPEPGRSRCTAPATSRRPTTRRGSRCTRTRPSRVHPDRPRARLGPVHAGRSSRTAPARPGSLFVGSPETVAQKIAWAMRTLGLSRFQLKYAVGTLPHEQRMESIRLYGEEVVRRVHELVARP